MEHDNGFITRYYHLKKGSPVVKVGDLVDRGDKLAEVGSSGSSTWPHLHFEVLDCGGFAISPMQANMFAEPPPYEVPLTLMELVVGSGPLPEDPHERRRFVASLEQNLTHIPYGAMIAVAPIFAGGDVGDKVKVSIRYANGKSYREASAALKSRRGRRHHNWRWTMKPLSSDMFVQVEFNGEVVARHSVTVVM